MGDVASIIPRGLHLSVEIEEGPHTYNFSSFLRESNTERQKSQDLEIKNISFIMKNKNSYCRAWLTSVGKPWEVDSPPRDRWCRTPPSPLWGRIREEFHFSAHRAAPQKKGRWGVKTELPNCPGSRPWVSHIFYSASRPKEIPNSSVYEVRSKR